MSLRGIWVFCFVLLIGCAAEEPGDTSPDGTAPGGCSVSENDDGTVSIKCEDGSEVTLGEDEKCSAVDNEDGTVTISCDCLLYTSDAADE